MTSLTHIFRIPVLIITTQRGSPELNDEPQHRLMGAITDKLFELMQIPWEIFPDRETDIGPALRRAMDYMRAEYRPYAFIMKKGSVAPHALDGAGIPAPREQGNISGLTPGGETPSSRTEALTRIIDNTPVENTVVIATTGYTGRELYAMDDRVNHLYMVGSMGCASSLGLGLAGARPDLTVAVVDGDGAALMRMGNFATIGTYGGDNLIHILLDNEVHDSTGAQSTVAGNVAFAEIAAACGYAGIFQGTDPDIIHRGFSHGPRFIHLKTRPGTIENLPRPDTAPEDVLRRLMKHIATAF